MQTARRANVKPGVHIRRHAFCSQLAMEGAPARAIQELAWHQNLSTTKRCMRLSPDAVEWAIRLLEQPMPAWGRGEIVKKEEAVQLTLMKGTRRLVAGAGFEPATFGL